jgi:hypothetical protein
VPCQLKHEDALFYVWTYLVVQAFYSYIAIDKTLFMLRARKAQAEALAHDAPSAVRSHQVSYSHTLLILGSRMILDTSDHVVLYLFEAEELSAELDSHAEAPLKVGAQDLLETVLLEQDRRRLSCALALILQPRQYMLAYVGHVR